MRPTNSALVAVILLSLCGGRVAVAGENPRDVVAAQLRAQGYVCESPKEATRDKKNSRPDEIAWIVECRNATYRVRLIPHMAARVELLDSRRRGFRADGNRPRRRNSR